MEAVTRHGLVEHVGRVTLSRHTRRRDDFVGAHEDPERSDLSPTHSRHADDLLPWFEVQELYERLANEITCNDVDAAFHQQPNGGSAGSGQLFPRKLKITLVAVPLGDEEMVSPILPIAFPLNP